MLLILINFSWGWCPHIFATILQAALARAVLAERDDWLFTVCRHLPLYLKNMRILSILSLHIRWIIPITLTHSTRISTSRLSSKLLQMNYAVFVGCRTLRHWRLVAPALAWCLARGHLRIDALYWYVEPIITIHRCIVLLLLLLRRPHAGIASDATATTLGMIVMIRSTILWVVLRFIYVLHVILRRHGSWPSLPLLFMRAWRLQLLLRGAERRNITATIWLPLDLRYIIIDFDFFTAHYHPIINLIS